MRTITIGLAGIVVLCAAAETARADQCAWIDRAERDRAVDELSRAARVIHFCEPCGDEVPGAPLEVGEVSYAAVGEGSWEVAIDGRDIDLAYTFVLAPGASEYRNLAMLSGCPADLVSESLRIDPATDSGVLITADSTPMDLPPPAIAAESPPSAVSAATPPAPPRGVMVINRREAAPTTLLDLAMLLALLANSLLLLAAVRRAWLSGRPAALPRATALVDAARAVDREAGPARSTADRGQHRA